MAALIIPESGLSLGAFPASSSKVDADVPELLGLTLTDNVIEEMIKCVQSGKPIQLSLGDHPSIMYGKKMQTLATFSDPFTHELYQSTNPDTGSFDMNHAQKMNMNRIQKVELAGRMGKNLLGIKGVNLKPWQKAVVPVNNTKTKGDPNTAGTDAALAALQSSLATENAKKAENTTKYIKEGLPVPGRRGGAPVKPNNKSKFLSQSNRSMPSSPALTGAGSPSLGPTSVPLSQQQAEHAKAARKPVIHLLAASPLTEQAIHDKVPEVSKNDLTQALQKVGDFTESTGMWELRRSFYKELDVYSFKYDSAEDRQQAIDNAVKAYDKMRLSPSDPEWDRLLIKAERGTGKCLSKLQAQIAQNSAKGPKINVENADSGRDTPSGKDDDLVSDKNLSKVKGEGTARSSPQGPATKTKKVSEKEAQAKRLLSKNPSKAAAKSAPKTTPKATPRAPPAKKQAPAKAKATTNAKVLSSEFVNESDDDDDHPPPPPPKPLAKVAKRSREEEEVETSDSSVPLSKKPRKEISVPNHRVSDASQTSRNTNYSSHYSSNSSKTKNNSPQKSSPLASSPPTNASEFDNSSADGRTSSSASPAHPSAKNTRSPIHKRHQKSSSVTSSSSSGSTRYLKPEVTDLARRFKMYYPKYEALHKEIELMISGGRRDQKKEQDLFDMHARLEGMKKQIFAGIVEY